MLIHGEVSDVVAGVVVIVEATHATETKKNIDKTEISKKKISYLNLSYVN